jgi:hypothetical protein
MEASTSAPAVTFETGEREKARRGIRAVPPFRATIDVGFSAGDAGEVQITTTATEGEPCPTCGEAQRMRLQINMGDGTDPFDRYLCEACCPPILHPPVGGLSIGPQL